MHQQFSLEAGPCVRTVGLMWVAGAMSSFQCPRPFLKR